MELSILSTYKLLWRCTHLKIRHNRNVARYLCSLNIDPKVLNEFLVKILYNQHPDQRLQTQQPHTASLKLSRALITHCYYLPPLFWLPPPAVEDVQNVQIVCVWCQKEGVKRYSLCMGSELKSFCSEKCFAACRRAYFKRNKVSGKQQVYTHHHSGRSQEFNRALSIVGETLRTLRSILWWMIYRFPTSIYRHMHIQILYMDRVSARCVTFHTQETQASSGYWQVNRPSESDTPDPVRS